MNSDAEVVGRLYELTRGELGQAAFRFPRFESLTEDVAWVRITRMARFWKSSPGEGRVTVERCTEDLVLGLHGQNCPFLFLLIGAPTEIQTWFGIPHRFASSASLLSLLVGAFPDLRLSADMPVNRESLAHLKHALLLSGIPSVKNIAAADSGSDQIEKVCRGLCGSNWAYCVVAEPVPGNETVSRLTSITGQIRQAQSVYLAKGSPIDEQNRTARRYVDLLERNLRRFEQGRSSGMWNVRAFLLAEEMPMLGRGRAMLYSAFSGKDSSPVPIRTCPCTLDPGDEEPQLEPLTSSETSVFARPPVEEYPGYEIVDYARFGVQANPKSAGSRRMATIGMVMDRGRETGNRLAVPVDDLTCHAVIAGVTGSGKTNTCLALLDQIWNAGKGVPFLVIESAKSEYRALLSNPSRFGALHIFTVGDETVSPLRLNPFVVPEGILIQTHLDYLKSLFSAAFVLYPPMPYVLEQSIQGIYEDRGWDLALNVNRRGGQSERRFPTLADLAAKVAVVIDRMGYDDKLTMDVKAGLLARIDQLRIGGGKGAMLDTRQALDPSALFETPCILELKQIVSDDEKAFIIGLILIRLYEYCESHPPATKGALRHVTLVEEAHRLLRNVSTEQGSEVVANPKGRAIEVFANILSEIRAYGEGIMIAEQIPGKLAPDAIKNTNLKIIHRLVADDDRRLVGSTLNLNESQTRFLATLQLGEAVAYAEGMQQPVLVSVPRSAAAPRDVSVDDVRQAMSGFWGRHRDLRQPLVGCASCSIPASQRNCSMAILRRVDSLIRESFIRLFNALRLSPAHVPDAYAEFRQTCLSLGRQGEQADLEYCVFAALADATIERRGEFYGWTHDDVETAVKGSCSVGAILAQAGTGLSETQGTPVELQSLAVLFEGLHRRTTLPFAGCRYCHEPCAHRFDMADSAFKADADGFADQFTDSEVPIDEVARLCWKLSDIYYPVEDLRVRRGAALCFAIQQLYALGQTRSGQEVYSAQIAESLTDIGGVQ